MMSAAAVFSLDPTFRMPCYLKNVWDGYKTKQNIALLLPLGVVGLYGGMKIAADMKTAEDAAIRSELKGLATTLIDEKIRSMKADFGATIHAYFDDLDHQLERVFNDRLDQAARDLEEARAIRDITHSDHQELQARIHQAKTTLLEFQGATA